MLSGYYPFYYDADTKMFVVGDRKVAVAEFDPFRLVAEKLEYDDDTDSLPFDELAEHPLMLPGFGAPLSGPKLLAWVKEHMGSLTPDIARVIAEAYQQFEPDVDIETLIGAGSHIEFHASVDEFGRPRFQTLGSCACLSVDVDSYILEPGGEIPGVEAGFAEYDLHNADTKAQRASLFAGLGHAARLAKTLFK